MKTKKVFLIFLTDVIPLIIISLLGIFKFKLFVQILGKDTLGLYQLFSQIMIYVAVIDGGLSSAVLYSLYKPNVEKNNKKVNALLAGAFRRFSLIGVIVFGLAFIVSFIVPFFIKDVPFEYWYIVLTFLLFSLSNVVGYFFVPHSVLLEVKEKKYIYNLVMQCGQIVLSTLEIIMLLNNYSFILILLMHSGVKLISYLVLMIICKKMYPSIKLLQKEKEYGFDKHIDSLIVHKVNGLVGSNIDSLIISKFIGLGSVAIYSTYSYIITMLQNIIGKLSSSMIAIVGNYLVKSREKVYEIYMEFNSILFYVAIVICASLTLAINGFIDIFYEGEIGTSILIAISFVSILFTYIIKLSTILFVSAGGLYKETRFCAITDTIINLILSLSLIHFMGISGVLIATVVSVFVAEYVLKTIVVHKKIFKISPIGFFKKNIKFFVIYILDLIVGFKIINLVMIDNIFMWVIVFVIFTIINALIILLLFIILKEASFINRIMLILKRRDNYEESINITK